MKLKYRAPALSIPLEQISKIVASTLRKKHWHRFKTATLKLVYRPIWLLTYEAFFEENGVVVGETSGTIAVDAVDGRIWEQIPTVLNEIPIEMVKETRHEYKAEFLNPSLSKEDAKELARIKVSALLKIPKDNVKVVGGELILYPLWTVWVEVRQGTFRLDIDGVSGMLFGAEKVPERERGWYEITKEVLEELKTPSGWYKYLKMLADLLHIPVWALILLLLIVIYLLLKVVIG